MISDRNFSVDALREFLAENDAAFTHPLSEVLAKQGSSLEAYSEKLAKLGTIACETDEDTGKIKGAVIGYTHDIPDGGGAYITQAVTGVNYRRQGVCGRLLKEFSDYCCEQNIPYVWLTTGINNLAARATYEKAGFQLADYDSTEQVKYVLKLKQEKIMSADIHNDLKGKRLLLLEGTRLTKMIIDRAHELGIYVVIANWYSVEDAPAKAYADKSYTVNIFDIPAMKKIIEDERIDGIFTGYTDSHLHIYEQLCRECGLPCFTNEELVDIMVDKALFKEKCKEAGLPIIDEYDCEKILEDKAYAQTIEYPVIIKPVDNSGARGISICHDADTLNSAIERGLSFSASKHIIIEKYLRGDYCLADFLIKDGKAYFVASSDKPANDDDKDNVNLPGAYIFPSKDNALIRNTLEANVQKFVENIGYKNGLLCFELINSQNKIYIIEAQFRYGAKFQEVFLKEDYGLDELEMLLRHALTGKLEGYELPLTRDFKRSYVLMNILLSGGTIGSIQDYKEVIEFPNVDMYVPMYQVGKVIVPDGSMVQRFGKVSLSADTRQELLDAMRNFQNNLEILDENGKRMVIASLSDTYK